MSLQYARAEEFKHHIGQCIEKCNNEESIMILRGMVNWPIHLIRLAPKCVAANICKQSLFVYFQRVQITLSIQVTHHHH